MSSNFDKFYADLNKDIEKEVKKQKSEGRKIILGAYQFIVKSSAVDLSYYKHSHTITVNKRLSDVDTSKMTRAEKTKHNQVDSKIEKEKSNITNLKFKNGDTIRIINPLDYAEFLESGATISQQQAPSLYGRAREKARKQLNKRLKI